MLRQGTCGSSLLKKWSVMHHKVSLKQTAVE